MKRAIPAILLFAMVFTLFASCTGAEGEAITNRTGESLNGRLGESLRGSIGESLSVNYGSSGTGGALQNRVEADPWIGTWRNDEYNTTLTIKANGRFTVQGNGEFIEGTYVVSGNIFYVTFTATDFWGDTYQETGSSDFGVIGDTLYLDGQEFKRR